jgi:hypothetical protein
VVVPGFSIWKCFSAEQSGLSVGWCVRDRVGLAVPVGSGVRVASRDGVVPAAVGTRVVVPRASVACRAACVWSAWSPSPSGAPYPWLSHELHRVVAPWHRQSHLRRAL